MTFLGFPRALWLNDKNIVPHFSWTRIVMALKIQKGERTDPETSVEGHSPLGERPELVWCFEHIVSLPTLFWNSCWRHSNTGVDPALHSKPAFALYTMKITAVPLQIVKHSWVIGECVVIFSPGCALQYVSGYLNMTPSVQLGWR